MQRLLALTGQADTIQREVAAVRTAHTSAVDAAGKAQAAYLSAQVSSQSAEQIRQQMQGQLKPIADQLPTEQQKLGGLRTGIESAQRSLAQIDLQLASANETLRQAGPKITVADEQATNAGVQLAKLEVRIKTLTVVVDRTESAKIEPPSGSGSIPPGPRIDALEKQIKRIEEQIEKMTATAVKASASSTGPTEASLSLADRMKIQAALSRLGLLRGKADGAFGKQTRLAIRAFQKSANEPVTGTLTSEQITR